MKKFMFGLALFVSVFSFLYAGNYPNIAVVTTNDDGLIGITGKAAGRQFYTNHQDNFDFLFIYTTFIPALNMQQGMPIQYTVQGINREGAFTGYGPATDWGSAGRLIGAARMCHIDQYPADPDAPISTAFLNPYAGMSSMELLAHEWSHYWLSAMDFKKEGMTENHTGLRGWESESANQHWSGSFMSGPSVMYGGDITDNGDGSFTYHFDRPKKYGPLDLYVMGLIPPKEVGELFFVCSSPDIEQCREGDPSVPAAKSSPPSTKTNLTKHVVTIQDIVRAMGPRVPASEDAPKHFNVAFILVSKEGTSPTEEQLQKLEGFRVRFQEWFFWATGERATICTELDGDCTNEEPDDDPLIDEDEMDNDSDMSDDEPSDNEVPDNTQKQDKDAVNDSSQKPDNDTLVMQDDAGCGCSLVF